MQCDVAVLMQNSVAVVGSGPAGLMAATVLAKSGITVHVYEKKRGPAAKLLLAGRSGLNISHNCTDRPIWEYYQGVESQFKKVFEKFSVNQWLEFVNELGIETFLGTSRRYFVKTLKAAPLLKAWIQFLKNQGVTFFYGMEISGFESGSDGVTLEFNHDPKQKKIFSAACLCLGGASWEPKESPLRWPEIFKNRGIEMTAFTASNAGFNVDWSSGFLKEAVGLPLKNIGMRSSSGMDLGEVVVTEYGLEGSPVYNLKKPETVFLDLKPDMSREMILDKLKTVRENLSPLRRIKKQLGLCDAALALLYHHAPDRKSHELREWTGWIKNFPVELKSQRGLKEAISSAGGVEWSEVNEFFMLKKFPGVFVAGEMLDWDAPTGGFLIQGCVSQGCVAAEEIKVYLDHAM